ncbi:DnaD domain-containing protein [Streptococcus dentiloxodontae]
MSFLEHYKSGNLVLPAALLFHYKDIFKSADDFLLWQFIFLQNTTKMDEIPSSVIAEALGKSPAEVNAHISNLAQQGLLDVETTDTGVLSVDASPALAALDKLLAHDTANEPVLGRPSQNQQLVQLTQELEQAMGLLNPMILEDLNKLIKEDHTDPDIIREALKEAVFNRKVSWNYIKAVLRDWRRNGITTLKQVEERRSEREQSTNPRHTEVSDDFKSMMDTASQLWGN